MQPKRSVFTEDGKTILLQVCHNTLTEPPLLHQHCESEWLLVLEGNGTIEIGGTQRLSVGAGDTVFFDSMQPHRFVSSDSVRPFETLSVMFDVRLYLNEDGRVFPKAVLDNFYTGVHKADVCLRSETPAAQKIQSLLFDIDEAVNNEAASYVIRALVVAAYAYTVEAFTERVGDTGVRKVAHHDSVRAAMVYINHHLEQDMTLEDIAAVANMNKTYFSTVFKKATGMTVWEYLLHARVERAISYLQKDTDAYTITEIFGLCGFNSANTFNQAFKKVTGKTPTEYKKSKYNACF